jgi:hypothetical protein
MEDLSAQYDKTLSEYNDLNKEYIEFLNSTASSTQNEFVTVDNRAYTGTNLSVQTGISTASMCSAICSKTSGCTGATFDSKACILQSGDGSLKARMDTKAIITKKKYYLIRLDNLNNILQALLKQMQTYQETNQANMASDLMSQKYAMNDMTDYLVSLKNQSNEYNRQITETEQLDPAIESSEQGKIYNQSWFQLFGIVAIAILIIVGFTSFISGTSAASTSASPIATPPAASTVSPFKG